MTDDYTLAYGTHATPEDGRCAMEWVSHLAGEPHSDHPRCVSPVVRAFCITLNDSLEDGPRQRLRPYLTRTIGTAGDDLDEARSWMALDWLIRSYTPVWLRLAGAGAFAAHLAELPALMEPAELDRALALLLDARAETRVRALSVLGGARVTLWSPWAAGRAAAREAAWGAAAAAAWAAARIAVGDRAGDRARALAREIAADAAAIAAREARLVPSRADARARARAALAPTLECLQRSAIELLNRLLPTVPFPLGELQLDPGSDRAAAIAAFTA